MIQVKGIAGKIQRRSHRHQRHDAMMDLAERASWLKPGHEILNRPFKYIGHGANFALHKQELNIRVPIVPGGADDNSYLSQSRVRISFLG